MSATVQPSSIAVGARLRVGFVCFGRATFDVDAANELARQSMFALQRQTVTIRAAEHLVTSVHTAEDLAEAWAGEVDVLLAQFTTFVDGRFIDVMAKRLSVPVIVWGIREPNQHPGERLSLNSLTGANMAAARLNRIGTPFLFLYGNPDEPGFDARLNGRLRYWLAWKRLRQFTIVTLGDAPDGFHFSMPGPSAQSILGIDVKHINLNEIFERALRLDSKEITTQLDLVQQKVRGISRLPEENVQKFARMMTVLQADLQEMDADAVAVRCWPEFFTEFGAAACSTLSALIDQGVMASCEADILGALSMDVLHLLSGSPAYLGDLVEVDESQQAVVFWHCGAGAFSLAREDTGAVAGVHPNRNVGFTLEFGLKPGRVTILRIGEAADGSVRALIGEGEVLDVPQRFRGTSATVRLDGETSVFDRVSRVIQEGFEPHYALAYGSVSMELEQLLHSYSIPTTKF